jgi:hypothetical protein
MRRGRRGLSLSRLSSHPLAAVKMASDDGDGDAVDKSKKLPYEGFPGHSSA